MTAPNSTFNLTALADRLFSEKRSLALAGKIRRARDVHSLTIDLTMALESLDALDALLEKPAATDDFRRSITESALLNNALILYARATKTASEERDGFDLRSRFSSEEKAVHQELSDLRDQAIAHFGSGGSYNGIWQVEVVTLQRVNEGARPGVVTRRQTLDRTLAKRARRQINVAYTLLHALRSEKLQQLTDALNEAAAENMEFHREISQHPLNLDVFLASPDAGETARVPQISVMRKGL